ncbi:hypothetical protein C1H46_023969 [Malus baccata]|uniref:Uncharacterized protein n=1 Tax=Malus baccata TaxID=106549 RepID=A0A540LVJ4_MALBA|nr:hypothetical protein C1H46_023969 [Malus baccata]
MVTWLAADAGKCWTFWCCNTRQECEWTSELRKPTVVRVESDFGIFTRKVRACGYWLCSWRKASGGTQYYMGGGSCTY